MPKIFTWEFWKNAHYLRWVLTLTLVGMMIVTVLKVSSTISYSEDEWTVRTWNAGFAIVQNSHGEELLVRNPLPNLQVGEEVTLAGFNIFDSNSFPYVTEIIK